MTDGRTTTKEIVETLSPIEIVALVDKLRDQQTRHIDEALQVVYQQIRVLRLLGEKYKLVKDNQEEEPKNKPARAPRTCSICHEKGHRAPNCPKRAPDTEVVASSDSPEDEFERAGR